MPKGVLTAICICPVAGAPMQRVQEVEVITGEGLKGDRYANGEGSFNKGRKGKDQVTLMNTYFVGMVAEVYAPEDTRRNLFVSGIELMDHIGYEFTIGGVRFRGVKYCAPCNRPSKLGKKAWPFQQAFSDRGGLVAEVLSSGIIRVGDFVIPRKKEY